MAFGTSQELRRGPGVRHGTALEEALLTDRLSSSLGETSQSWSAARTTLCSRTFLVNQLGMVGQILGKPQIRPQRSPRSNPGKLKAPSFSTPTFMINVECEFILIKWSLPAV